MDSNGHSFGGHSDLCLNCGCDRPGFFFGGDGSRPCPARKEPVEIWEKIGFNDGKAVSWERSLDDGKTWEYVNWPGNEIPFMVINPTPELLYIIEKHY